MEREQKNRKFMKERDKTNILTVLENLEQMFRCLRYSVNGISSKVQSLALAVEAQALATKIGLASKRWMYKLPFKEACDVDFSMWHKKVDSWIDAISEEVYYTEQTDIQFFLPNTDYYIDQFYQVRGEINQLFIEGETVQPYYEIADVEEYNRRFCELKGELECDWMCCGEEIDKAVIPDLENALKEGDVYCLKTKQAEDVGGTLRHICDDNNFFDVCTAALGNLSSSLEQAYRTLLTPPEEAYKALFERLSLVFYGELINDTMDSFRRWSSFAPTSISRRLKAFEDKFEKEKKKFFSGKWKEGLETYFDPDDIGRFVEGTDAGKFIYKYRCELSKDEVGGILAGCHKLACYYNEICRLKSEKKEKKQQLATSPDLPREEALEMEISVIFSPNLRHHVKAVNLFVQTLRACEPDIARQSGKNWGHVREAFVKLEFIDKQCSGVDFGNAIGQICSNRKAYNVAQALKRYNPNELVNKNQGFIDFFIEQFQPVKEMVEGEWLELPKA